MTKTAGQLYAAMPSMREQWHSHQRALERAAGHFATADPHDTEARRAAGKATWLVARLDGALRGAFSAPPLSLDHVVVAVDGSHVDIDRHAAARCFLINIGYVSLRYGEIPHAELRSEPLLCADEETLALRDRRGVREANIEGALLGMHRAVMEIEALGGCGGARAGGTAGARPAGRHARAVGAHRRHGLRARGVGRPAVSSTRWTGCVRSRIGERLPSRATSAVRGARRW